MENGNTVAVNAGAVPEPERIDAIDVLRGFAVLGILAMNIQSFSMISAAYIMPHSYGDMTGANYKVWLLCHIFADQKFMSIFSMLFGAGIILMTGRQESRVGRSAWVHYRRMFVLLCFGLLHAYGLWFGDILVTYALCGMIAYLFRRLPPWLLLLIGFALISVHTGIYQLVHWSIPYWGNEGVTEFRRDMNPPPEKVEEELRIYRGGWLTQMPHRALAALMLETFVCGLSFGWRAGGLMLVGMALFKLGFFRAAWPGMVYAAILGCGMALGVPLIIYGHQQIVAHNWEPVYSMFIGQDFNYWGSIPVCVAYCSGVMLLCQQTALSWLTRPFAAVGRMALTNYLMQTVICTTLFYGHGFGWFGSVERVQQFQIVLAIWAVQLIVSPIWLHFFRFGPAEWLWRALTYGSIPPFRR